MYICIENHGIIFRMSLENAIWLHVSEPNDL